MAVPGIHHVRAEAVAQDLAADVLLGERQPRAAVAGADDVGLFHLGVEDALDRRLDLRPARRGFGQRDEAALERGQQMAPDRIAVDAVLDLDDRAVEQVEQEVVAHARVLGHDLAGGQVLGCRRCRGRSRDLRLAPGANSVWRFGRELAEDLVERFADRLASGRRSGPWPGCAGRSPPGRRAAPGTARRESRVRAGR